MKLVTKLLGIPSTLDNVSRGLTDERVSTPWRWLAYGAAAVMTLSISLSLLRIPIQVTDTITMMLSTQAADSVGTVLQNALTQHGYFRPFKDTQVRLLLDLASGHYFATFKTFHIILVCALLTLFAAAARIRTRTDFLAFAFSLTVLTGLQTFRGLVWEAYPTNHFLEVAVCGLAAFVLTQSKGGWWADVLAILLFLASALTLESGILVWVVVTSAWIVG